MPPTGQGMLSEQVGVHWLSASHVALKHLKAGHLSLEHGGMKTLPWDCSWHSAPGLQIPPTKQGPHASPPIGTSTQVGGRLTTGKHVCVV